MHSNGTNDSSHCSQNTSIDTVGMFFVANDDGAGIFCSRILIGLYLAACLLSVMYMYACPPARIPDLVFVYLSIIMFIIHTHVWLHTNTYMHAHAYIHTYTHIHTCRPTHIQSYTHMPICRPTYIFVHVYTLCQGYGNRCIRWFEW